MLNLLKKLTVAIFVFWIRISKDFEFLSLKSLAIFAKNKTADISRRICSASADDLINYEIDSSF